MLPSLPADWLANVGQAAQAAAQQQGSEGPANNELFQQWNAQLQNMNNQAGPSNYNYYYNQQSGSIAPSLLAPTVGGSPTAAPAQPSAHPQPQAKLSIDLVDSLVSPPKTEDGEAEDADARSHHSAESSNHEHEHDEGVERDGMIWGMKVEDYRALSARERKRVRNRISARTFRAKRKEHLNSLESTLNSKDLEIKLAHEENLKLKRELIELKRRLAQYEGKPY